MAVILEVTGTEAHVCSDITKRQQLGITKYGTTVQDNPLTLRAWLEHAYLESLDKAVYLKRAIEELDESPAMTVQAIDTDTRQIALQANTVEDARQLFTLLHGGDLVKVIATRRP